MQLHCVASPPDEPASARSKLLTWKQRFLPLGAAASSLIWASGCEQIVSDCYLPILQSEVPMRVLSYVGDETDRTEDFCDGGASPQRLMEIQRDWGVLRLELWGGTHRLYLRPVSTAGLVVELEGNGIEGYTPSASTSFLAGYTHVKTFSGTEFDDVPADSETFFLDVIRIESEGRALVDRFPIQYDTVKCSCVNYDSL